MNTPDDRFYNPARINTWFAVASALTLLCVAGAIAQDHFSREWKDYQGKFIELEKARASEDAKRRETDWEASQPTAKDWEIHDRVRFVDGDKDKGELTDAQFDAAFNELQVDYEGAEYVSDELKRGASFAAYMYGLAAAESETEELLEKKAELEALIQDAENARDKAERDQRELQSDVDEWKSKLDHARALGHDEEAAVLQKEWNELRAQEIAVHNQMDRSKLERDTKRVALKELFEVGAGYEARANRLWDLAGVSGAERKVAAFRFGALRDAPLLDPFAPVKKIEQLVIPELTVDYNFAQIGRVDRCVTCHKGIDKIKVNQATGEIIHLYTEENTENPVLRKHSRPELFVSSLSPHGASKMGCTVCHDGMGFGLTFNDAYHTPSTPEQEKEWEEKYHWHKGHSWDYPMLPLTYIEASCAKCHRDPVAADRLDQFGKEIPAAPKYNEGLRLFERSACYGCHQVDGWVVSGLDKWLDDIKDPDVRAEMAVHTIGKSGPGLTRVASKWTSKEAAWKWIWAPRDFRPNTNMPHFFGQPNNTGTDPITGIDYDLRTRTEVWGMVEYLWANSEEWGVKMPRLKGDPENGKALFGSAEKSV
ncbi:MAG: hypothetical protein ACYTG4_13005, partial [Planctomycetota bacterium]